MKAIALLLLFLILASAIGRTILRLIRVYPRTATERTIYAMALGLGAIAYTVLALGLLGLLSPAPILISLALLALVSVAGWKPAILDLFPRQRPKQPFWMSETISVDELMGFIDDSITEDESLDKNNPIQATQSAPQGVSVADPQPGTSEPIVVVPWRHEEDDLIDAPTSQQRRVVRLRLARGIGKWTCGIVLAALGLIVMVNCFVPPGAHEWDALSYHLAAPKVYLQQHRIVFLPTDHHSNFPFTMEMLFTLGLLFDGFALANLFHFATAVLCIAAVMVIARRHLVPASGGIAALVVATSPIVAWESGAAYIEMGLALFVLLSIGAILEFLKTRDAPWLLVSGILMGFALSIKVLALVPFALLSGVLLLQRVSWRTVGWYAVSAIIVGCPFYIKSWVWTGNPVYPFAYRVFGGIYWNKELADTYATEQRGFGQSGAQASVLNDYTGRLPEYKAASVADRVRNMVAAPFDLVAIPRIFYNIYDPGIRSHLGFLFLALPPLALLSNRTRKAVRWLALLALFWFAAWSLTMQYVRYVVPMLPLLGLIGGAGAASFGRGRLFLQVLLWCAVLVQAGLTIAFFASDLPGQFERATNRDLQEQYLTRQVTVYAAEQWINQHAPVESGVVLFEENRGFYLDRPYLWGNSPHSLYIPYDRQFRTGADMAGWFLRGGYRYGIINLSLFPPKQNAAGQQELHEAVQTGTVPRLMLDWYNPSLEGEKWRRLIGDALRSGAAVVIGEATTRGAAVIEFRAQR